MLRAVPVLLALLAAAPAPAAPTSGARIVGGAPASKAYEHQAFVEAAFVGGTSRCGGTLIAREYVLTAAHCLRHGGALPSSINLTIGSHDISGDVPAANRFTGQIPGTVHPKFDGDAGHGYDAAVVHLDRPAPFAQARLLRPADSGLWHAGTLATAIGWGRTEDGASYATQLQEVQLPIFADDACTSEFAAVGAPPGFYRADTMLCAGGKDGRDTCQGDSGGPLLVPAGPDLPMGIAGIVSFGVVFEGGASCAENVPGIYSRVGSDPLNAWVRSVVPQVEIDLSPAEPEPGAEVTMTARGNYASFEWDTDNDGEFDDTTGASTSRRFDAGVAVVGVRAGGSEVRRVPVHARFRSPVGFTSAAVSVLEGEPIRLTVVKQGRGTGSVVVQPSASTAGTHDYSAAPITLSFGADQAALPMTLRTTEDREVEGPETMRVDLASHAGDLLPGTPGQALVTILDDDKPPRVSGLPKAARALNGRVRIRYRISVAGRVSLKLQDRRDGRSLGSIRRTHRSAGRFTARIRLSQTARRRLSRSPRISARLVVAITAGADVLTSRRQNLTLRR